MKPLPLLFILDNFPDPHAGTEGQFWLLFQNLDRSRVDPSIVLLRQSEYLEAHVAPSKLRTLHVRRLLALSSIMRVLRTAWWARRAGFRVAHIYFNDSAIVFPIFLKLLGIKVIVSRRDLGFWYTSGNLRVLRLVAPWVDRAVANCEAVRQVVTEREGFRREQVAVIYNGILRTLASPVNRTVLKIGESARLVVVVANLRPLKRINDAIATIARLQQAVGETHLLVVGEDRVSDSGSSHQLELQQYASQLMVHERVHFLGKLHDPMPIIAAADLCMLCSESEGLSNTVIEYMLAGKPVVCTNVGGNAELVVEDSTGHLVAIGDVSAMTAAAVALLGDVERAHAFGRRAQQRARELFTAESMVERQTRLYEALVNGDAA